MRVPLVPMVGPLRAMLVQGAMIMMSAAVRAYGVLHRGQCVIKKQEIAGKGKGKTA